MRKKGYTLIGTLLLSCVATVSYAQGYKSIVVEMADGTTTGINLEEGMTTEFTEDKVVFASEQSTVQLEKKDVVSMSFSKSAGITKVSRETSQFVVGDNSISFKGLPSKSKISLFDLSGACIDRITASGDYCLSLSNLATGIYIISINDISYKIQVGK